jgi:hypothetical protein
MKVRAIGLSLMPGIGHSDEEGAPVKILGAVHVRKLTGKLDDEAFGLDVIGLSRGKTLSLGLCSGRAFAAEEPIAKSNRFMNEARLNHKFRNVHVGEQPDFWGRRGE